MTGRRGVYFLANDKVKEMTIAFLNSFRLYNPDLPLCLIPFNDDCEEITFLSCRYQFTVFDNNEVLSVCDQVSKMFHGNVCGAYRKFAAWLGCFDEFLYIDTDTVVLDSVDFAFAFNKEFDVYTSHSNMPDLFQWCWKQSILNKAVLDPAQLEYSANTGFISSRLGVLCLNRFVEAAHEAIEIKDDMALICMEQPFFNYLFVNSSLNYSSLIEIYRAKGLINAPIEFWAGNKHGKIQNHKLLDAGGAPVFLVHWAGIMQGLGSFWHILPYKRLWRYYRYLEVNYSGQAAAPGSDFHNKREVSRLLTSISRIKYSFNKCRLTHRLIARSKEL